MFALGWLAYEIFLNVPPNEKPQIWQVGVFSVAAFFGIWLERILVRLFVSNIHLATDAEERVTGISDAFFSNSLSKVLVKI